MRSAIMNSQLSDNCVEGPSGQSFQDSERERPRLRSEDVDEVFSDESRRTLFEHSTKEGRMRTLVQCSLAVVKKYGQDRSICCKHLDWYLFLGTGYTFVSKADVVVDDGHGILKRDRFVWPVARQCTTFRTFARKVVQDPGSNWVERLELNNYHISNFVETAKGAGVGSREIVEVVGKVRRIQLAPVPARKKRKLASVSVPRAENSEGPSGPVDEGGESESGRVDEVEESRESISGGPGHSAFLGWCIFVCFY